QSVIKPFGGVNHDAPGDAAVIAPIPGETRGAVISCGIVPRYSDIDAYAMAAASVDEALRNAVCVGVDLDRIAGLDNFCWPDPVESEKTPDGRFKLAQLVRANRAIEDVCRAYSLPCISGKDSMKNDATLDGEKISVPPTLLFSLLGDHPDVRFAVSSDFKNKNDVIYLIGESRQELGASEISYMFHEESGGESGIGGIVPSIEPERNLAAYRALTEAIHSGLVASAHDCSDGGLAVAIAESCIGIDSGADIEISALRGFDDELDKWGALFGESLGRIMISVSPDNTEKLESLLTDVSYTRIGIVNDTDRLTIQDKSLLILSASIDELRTAWKGTLDGGAPNGS
ncbi:MAG: AIR synthase-related protein, partial [Candidatus Thermoplasmatota archaeon]|nr:AIR synthase-related protein [Candidatus Thermoplasmatota archaeon]